MAEKKKVVVMGGGTGTFVVLSGLKHYPVDLTAIVTMADTGGSARFERDLFGLLPNSDVRKALIGLAEVNGRSGGLLRELFSYRFDRGELAGMTFGNVFLVALTQVLGSQEEAIERAGEILRIKGKVLPVTMDKVDLVARYEDGSEVVGEHLIDEPEHDGKLRIIELSTQPVGRIFDSAQTAIAAADVIVFGPGDLYTSTLAPVVVDEVASVIASSKAKLVYVVNLMTKYGQTYGFKASDHVGEMEKYVGRKMDGVVINNAVLPAEALAKYAAEQAVPVEDDLGTDPRVVRAKVLQPAEIEPENGDVLKRSLLRHDPEKLAKVVVNL
jgi:uncharacterized cofD-like protein